MNQRVIRTKESTRVQHWIDEITIPPRKYFFTRFIRINWLLTTNDSPPAFSIGCFERIHMRTGTAVAIRPTSVSFCIIFLMRPCPWGEEEVQWRSSEQQQSGRIHTMLIKLRKLRNTHGWKANIIFSLLSRHFELLNKRVRLTFWTILHFGVRSAICLPFIGSIEWEWLERKNRGSSKATPLSRAAWDL